MASKGYIRLLFMVWSKPTKEESYYNGLEILENDFFELGFTNLDPNCGSLSENAHENIVNDLNIIYDYLPLHGFTELGLYEIYGLYSEVWSANYDYYSGGTEYDCDWDIEDIKIKKLDKQDVKRQLESMYFCGSNRYEVMGMIKEFGLTSEVITVREDHDLGYSHYPHGRLFNYPKEDDKIELSLLEDKIEI